MPHFYKQIGEIQKTIAKALGQRKEKLLKKKLQSERYYFNLENIYNVTMSYFPPLKTAEPLVKLFTGRDGEKYKKFKKLDKKIAENLQKSTTEETENIEIIGNVKDYLNRKLLKWKYRHSPQTVETIKATITFIKELEEQAKQKFSNKILVSKLKNKMLKRFKDLTENKIKEATIKQELKQQAKKKFLGQGTGYIANKLGSLSGSEEKLNKKVELLTKIKEKLDKENEAETFFASFDNYSKEMKILTKQDWFESEASLCFAYLDTLKILTDQATKSLSPENRPAEEETQEIIEDDHDDIPEPEEVMPDLDDEDLELENTEPNLEEEPEEPNTPPPNRTIKRSRTR